jgi:hypothetical protein
MAEVMAKNFAFYARLLKVNPLTHDKKSPLSQNISPGK